MPFVCLRYIQCGSEYRRFALVAFLFKTYHACSPTKRIKQLEVVGRTEPRRTLRIAPERHPAHHHAVLCPVAKDRDDSHDTHIVTSP